MIVPSIITIVHFDFVLRFSLKVVHIKQMAKDQNMVMDLISSLLLLRESLNTINQGKVTFAKMISVIAFHLHR